MRPALFFLLTIAVFPLQGETHEPLKVLNGKVKEVRLEKEELVLSFHHPVSGQQEELVLEVSEGTGFGEGVQFQDLREGDPVSVDYEEDPNGIPHAVLIKRVPLRGVPKEIALPVFPVSAREDMAQVYFSHALKSKQEGRLLTAELLFRRAIEMEPDNADYHFELGNLYIEREDLARAQLEFEQVIMISPSHLAAHYNLGLVYRELGLTSEARDQFRRVLDLDPTHVKAQLQIGYTYQEEGFVEDARQAFETAQEMDVTSPEPRLALEDLAEFEQQSRERSQSQSSGKEAMIQAGALLIQELLAKRTQNAQEE